MAIVCAVAVPSLHEEILLSQLPRDELRNLLKSSGNSMTEDRALRFLCDLLDGPSDVSLVLVDAGFDENYKVLKEVTEIANRTRNESHERQIPARNLNYELLVTDAIIGVLGLAWERAGCEVTSLDVVLDSANLSVADRKRFRQVLTENSTKYGLHIGEVTWCRNEDQPLLNAPDIIAGIMHRRITHDELKKPTDVLLQAWRDRRIVIQDGRTFVTLPT